MLKKQFKFPELSIFIFIIFFCSLFQKGLATKQKVSTTRNLLKWYVLLLCDHTSTFTYLHLSIVFRDQAYYYVRFLLALLASLPSFNLCRPMGIDCLWEIIILIIIIRDRRTTEPCRKSRWNHITMKFKQLLKWNQPNRQKMELFAGLFAGRSLIGRTESIVNTY